MTWLLVFTLTVLLLGGLALVPGRLPRLRLLAVLAAPAAVVVVWQAVHAYQGWPVPVTAPPRGAVFVAAQVDEPHWVYLWLDPRPHSPNALGQPRAYRLRYSDQLYAQILRAQQAQRRGQTVTVQKAARARHGHGHGDGQQTPAFALRRYQLPPVQPPAKRR